MENSTLEVETTTEANEGTVLVVTSKVKKYVKENFGLNTAGDVPEALTKVVAASIATAINNAKQAGRKTLMARDF